MTYTKIAVQADLPAPGEAKEFEVAGKTICVANVNGTCTAIDNVCLHMGGPLGHYRYSYDSRPNVYYNDDTYRYDSYHAPAIVDRPAITYYHEDDEDDD